MIKYTISYQGKTVTLREAAKLADMNYDTLRMRYLRGWRGAALFSSVGDSIIKHKTYHENQYKTLRKLAKEHNLSYDTVRNRYLRGWRGSALVQPLKNATKHYLTVNGVTKPLREWAKETGVSYATALSRIRSGKTNPAHILNPDIHMRYDDDGLPMPHHTDEKFPAHLHENPDPSDNKKVK